MNSRSALRGVSDPRLARQIDPPGEIAVIGGEMAVCCGENAVQLIEIQPENGKRMRGSDYLRGHAREAKAKVQ